MSTCGNSHNRAFSRWEESSTRKTPTYHNLIHQFQRTLTISVPPSPRLTFWSFRAVVFIRTRPPSTEGNAKQTPATAAPAVNVLRHARTAVVRLASAESTSTAIRSHFLSPWLHRVVVQDVSKATSQCMVSQVLATRRHCALVTSISPVIGLVTPQKTERFRSLLNVA